jgi:hypothetical protein
LTYSKKINKGDMIEKYFAKRIDINETLLLRKMSDEEIDNSEVQHYCDDDTSKIYKENELVFNIF